MKSCTRTRTRQSLGVVLSTVVTLATSAVLSGSATAATVATRVMKIDGGKADFGDGAHGLGGPELGGTITWSHRPAGGVLAVKARVEGILYMDSLDPGHARLEIQFRDCDDEVIETVFRNAAGGGGNANDPDNQRSIDVSFENPQLYSVRIRTWEVVPDGRLLGGRSGVSQAPLEQNYEPVINNGTSDFGNGYHRLGGPSERAYVSLARLDQSVHGYVTGTLYWDSLWSDGCARIVIDFEDEDGTNLATRTRNECGHTGNANDGSSQETFSESFEHPALHKVRLRVGSVVNGDLVNVVSRRFPFEQP